MQRCRSYSQIYSLSDQICSLCLSNLLLCFAETIDLNVDDSVVHKHTPYVIILLKVADEWAKTHGGSLPSTREEKKEFKELIRARMRAMDKDNYKEAVKASFKVFAPRGISSNLQRIINDSRADVDSNSSDFWVMVAALKYIMHQILSCVMYCHKHRIMHRDWKPDNLLIDFNASVVKIADFGMARAFHIPLRAYSPEGLNSHLHVAGS